VCGFVAVLFLERETGTVLLTVLPYRHTYTCPERFYSLGEEEQELTIAAKSGKPDDG